MDAGEASAAQLSGRRMQHGGHSTFRAGTQGNAGIGAVPKPAAVQSIPPLLLDLDGTLVDSAYEHVMAWREALEESEIGLPNCKIDRRIGMSGKLFLPTLLRELGRKTGKARPCSRGAMATTKQTDGARKNIKKAAQAPKRKRTIAHLPESTRIALGKQGAKIARQRRSS